MDEGLRFITSKSLRIHSNIIIHYDERDHIIQKYVQDLSMIIHLIKRKFI